MGLRVVVCRRCYRQLEKLQKLRAEHESLKEEIQTGIERVGQHFGVVASTSGVKQPADGTNESIYRTPPKRRRVTTPKQQALASIDSPKTPVVSVRLDLSFYKNYYYLQAIFQSIPPVKFPETPR